MPSSHTDQAANPANPAGLMPHLVAMGFVPMPMPAAPGKAPVDAQSLGTVLASMASLGFTVDLDVLRALSATSAQALEVWWAPVCEALRRRTGADRNMAAFVVYKNFPREVLEKSEAHYWFNQICMYLGAPAELFAEAPAPRAPVAEKLTLRVLAAAPTVDVLYYRLVAQQSRWVDEQFDQARAFVTRVVPSEFRLADFGFKENALRLVASVNALLQARIIVDDATDVLRLAAVLAGAEPSLRESFKWPRYTRAQRLFFLRLLEGTRHLEADLALRPDLWKQFLSRLHPGDYARRFPLVVAAYDRLYRGELRTFNARIEQGFASGDPSVLDWLATRPGEFARRLHKAYALFGQAAIEAFVPVIDKLETVRLVRLVAYLEAANGRQHYLHAPRGNWDKVRMAPNTKAEFTAPALAALVGSLRAELARRMDARFPQGIALDAQTVNLALPCNDQQLAPYGRGTRFALPQEASFVRLASYWEHPSTGNTWFDVGANFFDDQWHAQGACCWDTTHGVTGATFSGDPTNSQELKGRGCQMLDLDLARLIASGVRYVVWSVLSFNRIPFAESREVLATLQWGTDAQSGQLYEPARVQMAFPLKSRGLVKFVAYLDLESRELVYMDAALRAETDSAASNAHALELQMPAFIEYLQAQPTLADLLADAQPGELPVLFTDDNVELPAGEPAFVFRAANAANSIKPLGLADFIG